MNKILFVCYDGYKTTNTRVRCYRFSTELNKRGIKTGVFSFRDTLGASHDGVESYRVGFVERLSLLLRAINKLLKEDKTTIFYIQKAGYFALAPYIVHLIHGNRLILDYDDYEYEQSLISRTLLHILAKNSIFCIAASNYLKDLLSQFNRKVYYIPTGVDTEIFYPRNQKKPTPDVVFTWIGFIVDRDAFENILFILDCFEELTSRFPGARLEIAGGGKYIDEVMRLIYQKKNKSIVYKGILPPDFMPTYLSTVDVGLFILLKQTKYNYSKSPTKLFEYMAMGLPVLSTSIGEAKQVIKDSRNGFLVETREEFIKKAKKLITNKKLRQTLGKQALQTIKSQYSLKILCDELAMILRKESGAKN